jgi:hypothetical protein
MVTRADGMTTHVGITLHIKRGSGIRKVIRVASGGSIQAAIDSAPRSPRKKTLILVSPGTYFENLILDRRLMLQGHGAASTIINGSAFSVADKAAWVADINNRLRKKSWELLPGDTADFLLDAGGGITVLGKRGWAKKPGFRDRLKIDGFAIMGARRGGGVFAYHNTSGLAVSNNIVAFNSGNFGGGVRFGVPSMVDSTGTDYVPAFNEAVHVRNNLIAGNAAINGGGGVSLFNGSDDYQVYENRICGNFALAYGGGIAHFGLSHEGQVFQNEILFNHAFDEGGGMIVAGELVPAGAPAGTLTPGSGWVAVDSNLILGNVSSDDGGGFRTLNVNGQDVANNPLNIDPLGDNSLPPMWHSILFTNNMVVNNVAADVGGGVSLDDTARIAMVNNTISYNASSGTGVDSFGVPGGGPIFDPPGPPNTTTPLPAGLTARVHSMGLQAAFDPTLLQTHSDPLLYNTIIRDNMSYYYFDDAPTNLIWVEDGVQTDWSPPAGQGNFWNLAVLGGTGAERLSPMFSVLGDEPYTGFGGPISTAPPFHGSNLFVDPLFANPVPLVLEAGQLAGIGAFVGIRYTVMPPSAYDYHITAGPAVDTGAAALPDPPFPGGAYIEPLDTDFDGQMRPMGASSDIGADELQ